MAKGENGNFRSRLFGGFDRQDVVNYIESLAEERNSYRDKCSEQEAAIAELQAQISELQAANEELKLSTLRESEELQRKFEADMVEYRKNADIEAAKARELLISITADLKKGFEDSRTDIGIAVNHVSQELERAGNSIDVLTRILDNSGERIMELCDMAADLKEEDAD